MIVLKKIYIEKINDTDHMRHTNIIYCAFREIDLIMDKCPNY